VSPPQPPTIVYVHGAGNKPPPEELKRAWDQDLFGGEMGERTIMAHYADLLHARPGAIGADACGLDEAVAAMVAEAAAAEASGEPAPDDDLLAGLTPEGRRLALDLSMSMVAEAAGQPVPVEELLPLPPSLRRLLLRQLLARLIPDADAYFFAGRKEPIRQRLRRALDAAAGPMVVISHSLGTVIAYDVLREPRFAARSVPLLVTLGSPLGYAEIQDVVTRPLQLPAPVRLWANFADPFDVVALDSSLADDFQGGPRIVDARVDNPSPNNHAACGYLGAARVRTTVAAALPVG
jgi:hypothetical protein